MTTIPNSNIAASPIVTPTLSFPQSVTAKRSESPDNLPESVAEPQNVFQFDNLSPQSNLSPHFVEYEVKRGDTLSSIAKEQMGKSSAYMEIFEANRDQMGNPNDLRIGMVLKIPSPPNRVDFPTGVPVSTETPETQTTPPVTSETAEAPATAETAEAPATPETPEPPPQPEFKEVTVRPGQSLSSLALQHLGDADRYMEIFEANRDQLSRPESLRAGMTLKIPVGTDSTNQTTETPAVSETTPIDLESMTPRARELYDAMRNYQQHHIAAGNPHRAETTDAQLREIAVETDRAGEAFGVDPKIMLAVFAHESGGFDPNARSSTGAGGLGQLTGIAIRQVHFMAGMARGQAGREPYTQYQDNFIRSDRDINQRFDIKQNIWTSTAYMAYEIQDRNGGDVEAALERYGDPSVATYENLVNEEYATLFGSPLF